MKGGQQQLVSSATNFVTAWWCYIAAGLAVLFAILYYSKPTQTVTVKKETMCGSCPNKKAAGLW